MCKGMGAMQQKLKMKGKTRKGKRVWNNEDKEDKEDKEEKRIGSSKETKLSDLRSAFVRPYQL